MMLCISLIVVATIAVLSYRTGVDAHRFSGQAENTWEIRVSATELLSALKDAETGQRGYLLTGRGEYLAPYHQAVTAVPVLIARLNKAASGRTDQLARVRTLQPLIADKLAELAKTVQLRDEGRTGEAVALVESGQGKDTMNEIRVRSERIIGVATSREADYLTSANASANRLRTISVAGSLLLLGFLSATSITVFRGITLREALFKSAAEREEWLATTLFSIGDAVIATDSEARITFMNRVAQELTGWTRTEAETRNVSDVFRIVNETTHLPAESPVEGALARGVVSGLENHTNLIAKNGREIPIDDSGAPIRDAGGEIRGAVLVFRDITERRQVEIALRESEEFSRRIVESSPDCVTVLDAEGRLVTMNANGCRQLEIDEFSACANQSWIDMWEGEERGKAGAALDAARAGETARFHGYCQTAKGKPRWWEVIVTPIEGNTGTGNPQRFLAVLRDVTDKTIDQRNLALAHTQLQKMAADLKRSNEDLAQFAYAASHDLRSPLTSVGAIAELLAERYSQHLDDEGHEIIRHITSGIQRMDRLVSDLLSFARAGTEDKPTDVAVDANEVLGLAKANLNSEIESTDTNVTADPLPQTCVRETHLLQLFQNMIGNAIKYRGSDPPRIHVSAVSDDGRWLFSVKDNGAGIDAEHLRDVFAPFKRLHGSEISGSGIGLATCERIVSGYGGRIWVESERGEGSTFYFSLPTAGPTAASTGTSGLARV